MELAPVSGEFFFGVEDTSVLTVPMELENEASAVSQRRRAPEEGSKALKCSEVGVWGLGLQPRMTVPKSEISNDNSKT